MEGLGHLTHMDIDELRRFVISGNDRNRSQRCLIEPGSGKKNIFVGKGNNLDVVIRENCSLNLAVVYGEISFVSGEQRERKVVHIKTLYTAPGSQMKADVGVVIKVDHVIQSGPIVNFCENVKIHDQALFKQRFEEVCLNKGGIEGAQKALEEHHRVSEDPEELEVLLESEREAKLDYIREALQFQECCKGRVIEGLMTDEHMQEIFKLL